MTTKIVQLKLVNGDVCYTPLEIRSGEPLELLGEIFEENPNGSIGASHYTDGASKPFVVRIAAIATATVTPG